jgi:BirA family transcriptional regulator, biotin operon repressor / biotin---[acetyl-CoA-carboxylase] ligase
MTVPLGTSAARVRFPEILRFPLLDSTNEELRRRIDAGTCVDGLVILSDQQSGGRGRLGRTWASPVGNLHISIARRLDEAHQITTAMTLVTGQALAQGLEAVTGVRAAIKWPNDLQVGGLKLAGILVEGHKGWQIIGAGVNVEIDVTALPTELHGTATTLRDHVQVPPTPGTLAGAFLDAFAALEAQLLRRGGLDMEIWERYWGDRGRRVKAWLGQESIEGVPTDVSPLGVLTIRDDDGRLHDIRSGEILHLRFKEGRDDVPGD